jgi:hypothetical protein
MTDDMAPPPEMPAGIGHVPLFAGFEAAPVFAPLGEDGFVVSAARLSAVDLRGERQITLGANQVRHGGPSLRPGVGVRDGQRCSVVLSDNQCRFEADGQTQSAVYVEAARIVAANNVVRRPTERLAMILGIGRSGAATVLGNLTMGGIMLHPTGLNPPFNALNLIAP